MSARPKPLSGLTRRLIQDDLLDAESAEKHASAAKKEKKPLISYLVRENIVSAEAIASAAADEFGTPLFDLSAINPDTIPSDLVSDRLIRDHHAFPIFQRGNRLFVALSDPTNRQALADIQFQTGIATEEILVREDLLATYITEHLGTPEEEAFDDYGDDVDLTLETQDTEEEEENVDAPVDDTPVVRFINQMLLSAIRMGSSDLHFEPFEKSYKVRFRTDGILHEVAQPPISLAPRIAARN